MKENRLGNEKSPYLRQHRHNPVDWFPWGDEAFHRAKSENKMVFLSIGYSTCYWCHVMEKDSFEQEEVGSYLSENFINIKVDREEHPEVDEIYMDAVIAIAGHGGWPMSVFLTPDLKPVWGGTYFPRAQFLSILRRMRMLWQMKPAEILEGGEKLFAYLNQQDAVPERNPANLLNIALTRWKQNYDPVYGGFGGAPKFPSSLALRVLMRNFGKDPALFSIVQNTLDRMAAGGLFDQLGGGFHRYSTDEHWLVPHFEKMLYDNALLVLTYAEAYSITKKEPYAQIVREILQYVSRDLTSPVGGFYAAEDAGEVEREGEFYVWQYKELEKILTPSQFIYACETLGLREHGNFEHGQNILHLQEPILLTQRADPRFLDLQNSLLRVREQRVRPHRDHKILCSWNALMIGAYAKAYQVLGDEIYLYKAQKAAQFLQDHLWEKGLLYRRYCEGERKYEGTLADYAYLIQALIELYQADLQDAWLLWAKELQAAQDKFFLDADGAYFSASRTEKNLIVRKKELSDGALPSANAISLENLLRLHRYFLEDKYYVAAQKLIPQVAGNAQAFLAMDYADQGIEIILAAQAEHPDLAKAIRLVQQAFIPGRILGLAREDSSISICRDKPLAEDLYFYICEKGRCDLPRRGLEELAIFLASRTLTDHR